MDLLKKKWKVVEMKSELGIKNRCEDDSIYTEDNEEVLGCSEWLRCDLVVLKHIVDVHNAQLNT